MLEDFKTLLWFLFKGPKFYPTMISLIKRKFKTNKDTPKHKEIEKEWCNQNKISLQDCLKKLDFYYNQEEVFSNYLVCNKMYDFGTGTRRWMIELLQKSQRSF